MPLIENKFRVKIDYRKTLHELTKDELIQLILDFLDRGDYNSWKNTQ